MPKHVSQLMHKMKPVAKLCSVQLLWLNLCPNGWSALLYCWQRLKYHLVNRTERRSFRLHTFSKVLSRLFNLACTAHRTLIESRFWSKAHKTSRGLCRASTFVDHQKHTGYELDHFCVENDRGRQIFLIVWLGFEKFQEILDMNSDNLFRITVVPCLFPLSICPFDEKRLCSSLKP